MVSRFSKGPIQNYIKTCTFLYSDNKLSQRESEQLNQLTFTYSDLDKEKQPRKKSSQGGEKPT